MHDTLLTRKICREAAALCVKNKIRAIGQLCVSVHPKSHVTAESLLACLKENAGGLTGDDTLVAVLRDLDAKNEAEIRIIEGVRE
jgi:hypothetical protein